MWKVVVLVFTGIIAVKGDPPDPCLTATLINERKRSTAFNVTLSSDNLLCDRLLTPGWYRFKDAEIPFDQCLSQYRCGTHVPLWIKGGVPEVKDGMVLRTACGDLNPNDNDCCDYNQEVAVKNCVTYRVYYLQPTSGCSMAYCAGDKEICLGSKYSSTGYAPCSDAYPILTQRPFLTSPDITQSGFEFKCVIPFPSTSNDAVFEVTWLMDNRTVPGVQQQVLTGFDRIATLDGKYLEGHMNKALTCSLETSFADRRSGGKKSAPTDSNSYWVGLKYSTHNIGLDAQNHRTELVTLTSTIPIVCRSPQQPDCRLSLTISTNNENILTSKCLLTLHPTDWNNLTHTAQTEFEVTLAPKFPGSPSSNASVHTVVSQRPGPVWNYISLTDILITLSSTHPGGHCASVGDPHVRTFDNQKRMYSNFHTGQYVMVQQKHGSFRVETRTRKEGNPAFNCGVAAREGNDVIIVDMCDGRYAHAFPKLHIMNPSMFENRTEIVQDLSGNQFVLKFPSGAIVKIHSMKGKFIDLNIFLPGTFANEVEGQCGNFDGNSDNDLRHRDGKIDSFIEHPYPFIESWRIPQGQSLFEKAEPLPQGAPKHQTFCVCNIQTNKQECGTSPPTLPSTKDLCKNCEKVLKPLPIFVGQATTPSASVSSLPHTTTVLGPGSGLPTTTTDFPTTTQDIPSTAPAYPAFPEYVFPPPTQPPAPVPYISYPDAAKICYDVLTKYPSARDCINTVFKLAYTDVLDMCVVDVQLTGDPDYAVGALGALMEGCGFKKLTDPNTIKNGTFVMPPDVLVCPNACTGRGECRDGSCLCEADFEGSDCSVATKLQPEVKEVSGDGACDLRSGDCYHPTVIGENMRQNATRCLIKEVYLNSDGSTLSLSTKVVEAVFMSTYHVICPMPKELISGQAVRKFLISLTSANSSSGSGTEKEYIVYNSDCVTCDANHNCTVKSNACLIENRCNKAGEFDETDFQGWCNPPVSNTKWSQQPLVASVGPSQATAPLPPTIGPVQPATGDTSYYTAQGTGCGCYFDQDSSSETCACCQNFGCPCPAHNPHVCYDCINISMCDVKN